MAINDISLTSGMRSNLVGLQGTVDLLNRTQDRLSTGKRVNSSLDDPVNFFAAQSHSNRASDLASRKDEMNEGIQTLKAADAGITAISNLLAQAKSIATSALSGSSSEYTTLQGQFNTIKAQIDTIATDSGYKGKNLLTSDTLTVKFNEDGTSSLAIAGFNGKTAGAVVTVATAAWSTTANIETSISQIDASVTNLRTQAKGLASNVSIVTARQDFTSSMINTLKKGSDNLTLADMNEEGANMLMLQTRQALGTTALSLSAQAAQSILKLF